MKNIKHLLLTTFIILSTALVYCQVDRSVQPKPGPAPEIEIGDYQTFTLSNGLQVILVENHKLPTIAYQLVIDADPVDEEDAVGYVSLTGSLLRAGTENRDRETIDQEIDFIGGRIGTYQNGIFASSLVKHKDKLLDLMSDVLLNPVFPEKELEKQKKQSISALAMSKTNPAQIANRVARKLRYKNHPYGQIETEQTLENITRDICLEYYNTYYKPNISYLIVVGDITLKDVQQDVEKYFGEWEKADVPDHTYDFPKYNEGREVAIVHLDDAVQSYISISYPVDLKIGSTDAIPASLTNSILGGGVFSGRLMQNLREDKGYTYGARSSLIRNELVGYFNASAQVGTEVTDGAVKEFLYEMERIKKEPVTKEELTLTQNVTMGTFARSLEKPQTVADFAFNTIKYNLDKDYYRNFLSNIENTTIEDIQKMANKYILPEIATITVVGDKTKIAEDLKKYSHDGQVGFYDIYGNPVKKGPEMEADMTAEKVINNYIKAIGGKENIEAIESLVEKGSATINGMPIQNNRYIISKEKFLMEMSMNGRVMSKQLFDGEIAYVKSFQGEQELTGSDLEKLKAESYPVKELYYGELGIQTELLGMDNLEGTDVYKVKIISSDASGSVIDYFDASTGLKVQRKTTIQTPQGEFSQIQKYSDYREVENVLFPFKMELSGMQNMVMHTDSIEINVEIPPVKFVK